MAYKRRQIDKIIEEICNEKGIELLNFSGDFIKQLKKDGKNAFVFGYKFSNNNAAIGRICDDKGALSDVLKANNIPCVEHIYIEGPSRPMTGEQGIMGFITNYFNKYGKIVCKQNSGTGGLGVYKCETMKDVETAVFNLLSSNRGFSLSPFIDIQDEYRIIVENGKARLIYRKERPYVVGDGKTCIVKLIENLKNEKLSTNEKLDIDYVPQIGEKVTVSWKHNLGQGSAPEIVEEGELKNDLKRFALKVGRILGIDFASIDIIKDNEGFKVLEINSGIMMESFSKVDNDHYQIAKSIYSDAIDHALEQSKKYETIYKNSDNNSFDDIKGL